MCCYRVTYKVKWFICLTVFVAGRPKKHDANVLVRALSLCHNMVGSRKETGCVQKGHRYKQGSKRLGEGVRSFTPYRTICSKGFLSDLSTPTRQH